MHDRFGRFTIEPVFQFQYELRERKSGLSFFFGGYPFADGKCLLDVSVTLNIIFFQTLIGPSPSGHNYKDLSKPMSIITQIQSTNVRSACMISYSGNVVYKGRPAGSRVMRSPLFPPDLGLTNTCQWEHHLRNSNQR